MARARPQDEITTDILLRAYSIGLFPMAEDADDPSLFWVEPIERGVFPLDGLIVSKSLAKTVRSDAFEVRIDTAFDAVIEGCAAPAAGRTNTWINQRIRQLYGALFRQGHVHTVEVYKDGALVGGLYGLHIGAAFFGESMFHRERDASKVALVHLVARLRAGGFRLLDTQFVTAHLASLGAVAIKREAYRRMLDRAIHAQADFLVWPRATRIGGRQALATLAGA
jgi:leucyl/phenylalanyl-tRNA--protein transferase